MEIEYFHKWESVKTFIAGLGNFDFKHIRLQLCIKFIKNNMQSANKITRHLNYRHYVTEFSALCMHYDLTLSYDNLRLYSMHAIHVEEIVNGTFKLSAR